MNEELRDEVALNRTALANLLYAAATQDGPPTMYFRMADALAPLLDRLTQERDRAREQVARVGEARAKWWRWSQMDERIINHAGIAQDMCYDIDAALGERP